MGNEPKRERIGRFLRSGKWNAVMIVDAILESGLSHSEKIVLLAIASHRSNANPRPSPGIRRLAALSSQKADTVIETITRLEARGVLTVERRHRQCHTYDLSSTMRGLLAVPSIGTARVPNEVTPAVPSIGAAAPTPHDLEVSRSGSRGVPIEGSEVSRSRERNGPSEGTNEGTSEREQAIAAPLTLSPPSVKLPRRPKARRWTTVPTDWKPTDAHRALAVEQHVDLALEERKFRNHEFRSPKSDPDRAFSNWLLGANPSTRTNGRGPLTQANHGIVTEAKYS